MTTIRRQTISIIILLAIQFVLGMVLNLFVDISKTQPGTMGSYFASKLPQGLIWSITGGGGIWLALHVIVGTLLILAAIFNLVSTSRSGIRKLWLFSLLGALFIVGAWINGNNFIDLGQNDINSLVMAMNFLTAFLFYVALLVTLP